MCGNKKIKLRIIICCLISILFLSTFNILKVEAATQKINNIYDIPGDYTYSINFNNGNGLSDFIQYSYSGDWKKYENFYQMEGDGSKHTGPYGIGFGTTVPANSTKTITDTLHIRLRNVVINNNTGELLDLNLKFSNVTIKNTSSVELDCVVFCGDTLNNYKSYSLATYPLYKQVSQAAGYEYVLGIQSPIEVYVTTAGTNTKQSGTIPWGFEDLDVTDWIAMKSNGLNYPNSMGGPWAESITFNSGVQSDYYLSTTTQLAQTGNRFYNNETAYLNYGSGGYTAHRLTYNQSQGVGGYTNYDGTWSKIIQGEDATGVSCLLNANSSKFTWTGSSCQTGLYSDINIKKGSVDVTYKTTSGQILENTSWVRQNVNVGTNYSTTQKSFSNYHFVRMDPSSAAKSGNVTVGTKHVIYLYEHDKGSVDVVYKDTKGNILEGPTWVHKDVDTGTSYTTTQKTFPGYTFKQMDPSSDPKNGTVTTTTKHVIYIYERDRGYVKLNKTSDRPDLQNTYPVIGAQFTIYTDQACINVAKTWQGNNAILTVSTNNVSNTLELETGTYYLKETKVPSNNYQLSKDIIKITISKNETSTIDFENLLKPGNGKVNKTF